VRLKLDIGAAFIAASKKFQTDPREVEALDILGEHIKQIGFRRTLVRLKHTHPTTPVERTWFQTDPREVEASRMVSK